MIVLSTLLHNLSYPTLIIHPILEEKELHYLIQQQIEVERQGQMVVDQVFREIQEEEEDPIMVLVVKEENAGAT